MKSPNNDKSVKALRIISIAFLLKLRLTLDFTWETLKLEMLRPNPRNFDLIGVS